MGLTQNGLTANFPHMLLEQSEHVTEIIRSAMERQAQRVEPTAEAEADWVRTIREKAMLNREFLLDCTPGYYNNEGRPGEGNGIAEQQYGGGPIEFYELVRRWRADRAWRGLDVA